MKARLIVLLLLPLLIYLAWPSQVYPVSATTAVFINEIHYDNTGADTGEAVEIAGPAGTDLTGWRIVRYNGNGGDTYTSPAADPAGSDTLSSTIPDTCSGYGVVVVNYQAGGLQNGAPDAIALVDDTDTVVQFLSYEGVLTATAGLANGLTSTDIGVSESGVTLGHSLQLGGTGTTYEDFTWNTAAANTFGACNTGQSFSAPVDTAPTVFIAFSANNATGVAVDSDIIVTFTEDVTVTGTWFSIDCSGVSYTATVSGGPQTYTLNPDSDFPHTDNTACVVKILAAQVADQDGTADNMELDYSLLFAIAAPVNNLVINEVDADTPGSDTLEFVELYDGGIGNVLLDNLLIVFYNGNGAAVYDSFDLDGFSTDANGYFVLGNAGVSPTPDIVFSDNGLQNGADAVAMFKGDTAPSFGTAFLESLDALVYDTNDDDDNSLLWLITFGQPQVNEDGNGDKDNHSNQRCPNGAGGRRNTTTYTQAGPTPGAANNCGVVADPFGVCGDSATLISAIQGSGTSSPLIGQAGVIVEGIVTGDYQEAATGGFFGAGLGGFFVQEEDGQADGDPATSEGIFVADGSLGVDVNMGDLVRVQGNVAEVSGLTSLNTVSNVAVCSTGSSVAASTVSLPVADVGDWEAFEGMLINIPQTLTATEHYNLGRYGEVDLSAGRLYNPTQITTPGTAANDQQALNDRSKIRLDDGDSRQNADPTLYPTGGLSYTDTLRTGYSVEGITGVLHYAFGAYRVQSIGPVTFNATNPRPSTPAGVGGTLKVASFNVLNYFNGDGADGGFPTSRGADTADEFTRQRDKIISAIEAMDADIIGLMEIENDGYGAASAIQDLVNGLNAVAGAGSYAFIDPGVSQIGTDQIAVGLIYKAGSVTPVGAAAILDSSVDANFIDTKNRPVLAQTFEQNSNGEQVTIAVNHLKSKGSNCDSLSDPDTGDGQGECNQTRTSAATALATWLATDPTGSGDDDFLIIGDLNAYAMEDPITALKDAGYTDLLGPDAYSYVFSGQWGTLDYALANAALQSQVTGATAWHINADEPRVLDYNEEFKSANHVQTLYAPTPYRASDHDPVIVGLDLGLKLQRIYTPLILR